jgi:hypothetical protein
MRATSLTVCYEGYRVHRLLSPQRNQPEEEKSTEQAQVEFVLSEHKDHGPGPETDLSAETEPEETIHRSPSSLNG